MSSAGAAGTSSRTYSFKVVLLGEGCVGKTSLVLRYCENKFNDKHITTLQVRPDRTAGLTRVFVWGKRVKRGGRGLGPGGCLCGCHRGGCACFSLPLIPEVLRWFPSGGGAAADTGAGAWPGHGVAEGGQVTVGHVYGSGKFPAAAWRSGATM